MGSLSLLAGWEGQNGALQTLGIDMFAQAKQVGHMRPTWVNADAQCRVKARHEYMARHETFAAIGFVVLRHCMASEYDVWKLHMLFGTAL